MGSTAVGRADAAVGAEPARFARGSEDDVSVTDFAVPPPVVSSVAASEVRTAAAGAAFVLAGLGFASAPLALLIDFPCACVGDAVAAVTRIPAVTGCGFKSRAATHEAAAVAAAGDDDADVDSDSSVEDVDSDSLDAASDAFFSPSAESCLALALQPVDPAAHEVASTSERQSDCFITSSMNG